MEGYLVMSTKIKKIITQSKGYIVLLLGLGPVDILTYVKNSKSIRVFIAAFFITRLRSIEMSIKRALNKLS